VYEIAATNHVLHQITGTKDITPYDSTPVKWGQWSRTWTHQSAHAILGRQQGTKYVATHESAGPGQEDCIARSCHPL